ncbi:hypothetical protein F4779DRAFT_639808 [Xylariaceae sp. FL0662B]|nr:hypothetical protein F4779DRAFT_639808 [Xylariaceae sp. FL0662B]
MEEENNAFLKPEEETLSGLSDPYSHTGERHSEEYDSLSRSQGFLGRTRRKSRARYLPRLSCNVSGFILILAFQVIFCTLLLFFSRIGDQQERSVQETPFAYSPVLNHIDLPFKPKQIDAHRYTNQSIYVGQPSREVDRAWDRIQEAMILGVTREDVTRVGKNADKAVPFDPAWGLGGDIYMAEVDVFHQIHCLNVLRKALITNYDYYWGRKWGFEPPLDFKTHLRHCTSLLLQGLMCHADVEVITHEWNEEQPWPFPDFGVVKQCRDFDALLEWAEANNLPKSHSRYMKYRPPPGWIRVPKEEDPDGIVGEATGFNHGTETQKICVEHFPYEIRVFEPNYTYWKDDGPWAALDGPASDSPGFVRLNREGNATEESGNEEWVYGVSVLHQLHCLGSIRSLLMNLLETKEHPHETRSSGGHSDHSISHVLHCFDYIRQGLQCAADVTLEKADASTMESHGWGDTHVCRSWDAVWDFLDKHKL